jgi:hypothetical protein
VAIALAAAAVASIVLGGALASYSAAAAAPATYSVSGLVEKDVGGIPQPADHAVVVLTDNGGANHTNVTGPTGRFTFPAVPSGGVSINVTLAGYAPETLTTFVSPVYDAGSENLTITLEPLSESNGSTVALAPFPDLESFLASIDGAAALLAIGGTVAAFAALAAWRHGPGPAGVVGGGAGIAAPVALYFLGLFPAFPVVLVGAAVAAGFGAFALTISAAEMYRTGTPAGSA